MAEAGVPLMAFARDSIGMGFWPDCGMAAKTLPLENDQPSMVSAHASACRWAQLI